MASIGATPIMVDADEAKLQPDRPQSALERREIHRSRAARSSCRVREDADAVQIEVRDTGIGMTPDDIETALTPFAQVDGRSGTPLRRRRYRLAAGESLCRIAWRNARRCRASPATARSSPCVCRGKWQSARCAGTQLRRGLIGFRSARSRALRHSSTRPATPLMNVPQPTSMTASLIVQALMVA